MLCPPWNEASRKAAFVALQQFLPRAGAEYAAQRNFDYGPGTRSNVSGLSAYIRHRLVHEGEILDATLQRHSVTTASKFIEEIFWRAYFKGWLEHHPTVWMDYRSAVHALAGSLKTNSDLRTRYKNAVDGATGIDCFDAWVGELKSTGYLHNHARMWFASIWVYTLQLPWQLGADLFYRHLVDGDPASNTLSWRWVCGLHTKGKTYLARVSNIASYTDGRFNPQGLLAHEAKPLKEAQIHATRSLPPAQDVREGSRLGLLVTEEDCSPESLPLQEAPIAVLGAVTTNTRSPLPVGRPAREFAIGAVADGVERAARYYDLPAQGARSDSWDDALLAWARSNDLDTVVTAYAPVGPVAERLASARQSLAKNRIELIQIRRAYDTCTWPHATKGYFKLKSRIPDVLGQLGISSAQQDAKRASN
jgi:deoxyribodipyrimidine photo-lyase